MNKAIDSKAQPFSLTAPNITDSHWKSKAKCIYFFVIELAAIIAAAF